MTKTNKQRLFLSCLVAGVVILAAVLRLYKLDQYPPQLNRDEAALAINALYIQQAGVDEWGERLPLQFKSLGDYKLPGYIYVLSALFHFKTSDFIVRLPSAFSGIVLVGISSLWLRSLLRKKISTRFLLFFLMCMTIAPFAIFYSRMAWEANLALTLMISALVLLHDQKFSLKKDLLAVLLYLAAVLTYNSPFLLLPFFVMTLPFFRGVKLYKNWTIPVVLLILVFIGVAGIFARNNSQKSDILFFTDANILAQYPTYRMNLPPALTPFIGSQLAYFGSITVSHYLQTFLPEFLVIHGGQHPWHSILGRGHLYWTIYVLFLMGLAAESKKIWQLVVTLKTKGFHKCSELVISCLPVFFLLASPLPAIFTTDAPHATRSLFTFVMIVIFATIGFESIFQLIKKHDAYIRYGLVSFVTLLLVIESSIYFYQYFIVWPKNFSPDFQLGFLPVLQRISSQQPKGNIAIIDFGWYMYVIVAWYQKIPASEVLNTIERSGPDMVGLYRVNRVGRFYFVYHDDEPVPNKQGLITRDRFDGHWKL